MKLFRILLLILFVNSSFMGYSQKDEILYLSGTGLNDTKKWDFYCTKGMNSGKWSKIEVPSQWELQGFGEYTYGRFYLDKTAKPSDEEGLYKYKFKVPSKWKNKNISIVFEGAMTDTEVKINGVLAGEIHQGGFVRFHYDITDLLKVGKNNLLEVKVSKESSNNSVNRAERRADWWLFGGIYRPVYLKASPKTHIKRIAVDANDKGELNATLFFENLESGYSVATSIEELGSNSPVGRKVSKLSSQNEQIIKTKWDNVKLWDSENPNLYLLSLELLNSNDEVVHRYEERIGFRTIEFREKDGIYLNGTKIVLKGVNRHTFHPDGGRTTNKEISLQDALLIKDMNMNAVRSHYPPDKHFLDICDSLGIFYLNELPGWHNRYGNVIGEKVLNEMIARDVNHPSIFMWANGNEGGWNTTLDSKFAELDPQKRHVVHPWADFNGIDTHHYPAYQTGPAKLANGYKVFMPTEFLHGQYDKGHGAGLEDYWSMYKSNPMFAGGFLWTYIDEAVRRTDKNGFLDSDGPNGPDGIVGPYREKEGSYYTIKEVWAPIQFDPINITKSFKGEFLVENDYLFTNLNQCRIIFNTYKVSSPINGIQNIKTSNGKVNIPSIEPGEKGRLRMEIPNDFFNSDVLEIVAYDKNDKHICTWTWPIKFADEYFNSERGNKEITQKATVLETEDVVVLSANGIEVAFKKEDGTIKEVIKTGNKTSFKDGPVAVGIKMTLREYSFREENGDAFFVVKYRGGVDSIQWRMKGDGLLEMAAVMLNKGRGGGYEGAFFDEEIYNLGFSFSYDEEDAKSMEWMGRGPYRVWKNRIKGANYGLWQKDYNNTVTGESFHSLIYPEFKGYHANIYWASIVSDKSPFTVYSETDGVYFRIFTPEEPEMRRNGENSMWDFPEGDISFLLEIPAIRSFKTIPEHGPKSQPTTIRIKQGDEGIKMKLWFNF